MGDNLINYPGNVSTNTADMTTVKIPLNSTISTAKARFATIDIKNFYLGTPMKNYESILIDMGLTPPEIIKAHTLKDYKHNSRVYMEIRRGMCGLPQIGKLANDLLKKRLEPLGCIPMKHTTGFWQNKTRPILFN